MKANKIDNNSLASLSNLCIMKTPKLLQKNLFTARLFES